MKTTKEKHATHTPGPWVISCIDGVENSLMVGGGDDGSDIVSDIRTHENDIFNAQAELYDDVLPMRSKAHAHGDCTESLDKHEKEVRERLAELESKEKEANANARLIASAPEMLEALRVCLTELEDWNRGHEPSEGQELARELLAKVEGGEG